MHNKHKLQQGNFWLSIGISYHEFSQRRDHLREPRKSEEPPSFEILEIHLGNALSNLS